MPAKKKEAPAEEAPAKEAPAKPEAKEAPAKPKPKPKAKAEAEPEVLTAFSETPEPEDPIEHTAFSEDTFKEDVPGA